MKEGNVQEGGGLTLVWRGIERIQALGETRSMGMAVLIY